MDKLAGDVVQGRLDPYAAADELVEGLVDTVTTDEPVDTAPAASSLPA
jgi:hypothetical protein